MNLLPVFLIVNFVLLAVILFLIMLSPRKKSSQQRPVASTDDIRKIKEQII